MADTFRREYKPLDDTKKYHVESVKEKAEELLSTFENADWNNVDENTPVRNRCIAIAKTKLEEAVMWAVKGITA